MKVGFISGREGFWELSVQDPCATFTETSPRHKVLRVCRGAGMCLFLTFRIVFFFVQYAFFFFRYRAIMFGWKAIPRRTHSIPASTDLFTTNWSTDVLRIESSPSIGGAPCPVANATFRSEAVMFEEKWLIKVWALFLRLQGRKSHIFWICLVFYPKMKWNSFKMSEVAAFLELQKSVFVWPTFQPLVFWINECFCIFVPWLCDLQFSF